MYGLKPVPFRKRVLTHALKALTYQPGRSWRRDFGYADAVEEPQADQQLAAFIAKFSPEIAALAESILAAMRERYPTAIQLVYDNYNALAIGFGPSERASMSPGTSGCLRRTHSMNCR